MSEESKKKTSGSSKSGASKSSSGSRPAGQSKTGITGSRGTSQKKNSSQSRTGSSTGSAKSSSAKSGTSGSGTKKTSGSAAKSTGKSSGTKSAGTSRSTSGSTSAKKSSGTQTKRTSGSSQSAKKRSGYDDIPRNPRRDSQDERDLHNSASAKRIAEERRRRTYNKNRRLYNFMFYAAIAVAVISVVIIMSVTVLFNITDITVVRGDDIPYTDAEILTACGIEPGDNLFAIDAEQASADVKRALPYIEVCKISRKLPSTLELDVRPAIVLGSVTTTEGAYIMLSASGRALEYADSYTGTPAAKLNGLDVGFEGIGAQAVIDDPVQLQTAAEIVVGYGLYGLTLDTITFEAAGTVSLSYDERIQIYIGVPVNLSQKIQVSASMITDGKIARNESGVLDMSIDERAVFTPDYLLGEKDYGQI